MIAVTCLSNIPTKPHLSHTTSEFELLCPVYLLQLWKDPEDQTKAVIFTDFHSLSDASIENPLRVTCSTEYPMLKEPLQGLLPRNKLFLLSIEDDSLFDLLSRTIRNIVQGVTETADFSSVDRSQIYEHGLVAKVEASLELLPSGVIEGKLKSCVCIAPKNVEMLYPEDSDERIRLVDLLKRLKSSASEEIIDAVRSRLPIDDIIEKSRSHGQKRRKHKKAVIQSPCMHPTGAELVFGHRFDAQSQMTQMTQQPRESASQAVVDSSPSEKSVSPASSKISITSDSSSDEEGLTLTHFASALPTLNFRSAETSSQLQDLAHEVLPLFPGHLVKRATVSDLLVIEQENDVEVDSTLVYVVRSKILGYLPPLPFVVKPYKRTVKLAPFKVVLRDNRAADGTTAAMVELRTSEEVQLFLGLAEPEDSLRYLEQISAKMERLVDQETDIAVQPMRTEGISSSRIYWRCMSKLDDLCQDAD